MAQINTKLGEAIPNGGIAGRLGWMTQALKFNRISSLLNTIILLHNAQMLSRAIAETLFAAIDNTMEIFKVRLKDEEGNEQSFSEAFTESIETFANRIIGEQNVDTLQNIWIKFNRIYQAGANIIYSIQSINYSVLEALETVGNYVAWIGNAAKRFGVVTEKAYAWMNPDLNFMNSPLFRRLDQGLEIAESLEVISGEILSATESATLLAEQSQELIESITEATELIQQEEEQSKEDSEDNR